MSTIIKIGDAGLDTDGRQYFLSVKTFDLPDAPSWPSSAEDEARGGLTKTTSLRLMNVHTFMRWIRETGLSQGFDPFPQESVQPDGRIGFEYPDGVFKITDFEVQEVTAARERWVMQHPGAKPGFLPGQDGGLAYLIWLEWWLKWALANCTNPAIEVSP